MEPTQLGFEQSRTLLDAYGIPVLGRMVRTPEQAVVAAWDLGFPVAMKTVSSQIVHKTDLGCVLLGLADRAAELGKRALERLHAMEGVGTGLRNARGRGLLLGIEVTDAAGHPDPLRAERIRGAALAAGVNFKLSNGATITLSPPLVIGENDLDRALGLVETAARAVSA